MRGRELTSTTWRFWIALVVGILVAMSVGCGDEEEEDACAGRNLVPHLSPVSFGDMYPTDPANINLGTTERSPYEWVLRLQAKSMDEPCVLSCFEQFTEREEGDELSECMAECGTRSCDTVHINKVCKVGGGGDHFVIYHDDPLVAEPGDSNDAAVQITYQREVPADPETVDNIALVVESDAQNFPVLVIPICARVVADGADKGPVTCTAPNVSACP